MLDHTEARKGRPPMKEDPDFKAQNDAAFSVTGDRLRAFIERWERLEAEKKEAADDQKEIMQEAKGSGFDVKAIRQIIALRKRNADDLAEEEAVLELYKSALGM